MPAASHGAWQRQLLNQPVRQPGQIRSLSGLIPDVHCRGSESMRHRILILAQPTSRDTPNHFALNIPAPTSGRPLPPRWIALAPSVARCIRQRTGRSEYIFNNQPCRDIVTKEQPRASVP